MSRIRLLYWPVLFLSLWSCRKDVEQFLPYAPSADDLSSLLATQVPRTSTRTMFLLNNLSTDKVLETPNGTRIFLIDTDHLFANAATGLPVPCSTCADLKIEVTEVFDKSDIMARALYTTSEDGTLFESGGMVLVSVFCGGDQLEIMPTRTLKVQIPNSEQESGFFVFDRNNTGGPDENWIKSSQEVFEAEWPNGNGGSQKGYELLLKHTGWAACGRSITDTTSTFCIELPSGFGGQNTLAYIVFKNQQVVAPLEFDLSQNKFCCPQVPVGFQVHLATVSKLGGQYWLGNGQTETGTNATFPLNTQEMTEGELLNFIKSL